jgi:hypothetical protein
MKNKTQKLDLKLRGKVFSVRPVNKHGRLGKRYDWDIRKNGKLPSAFFFHLRNYVTRRIQECDGEDLSEVRRAVREGLREAAKDCGCEARRRCVGDDLVFYLKGTPLIAFVIPKDPSHYEPPRELLQSDAVFRWIVKVQGKNISRLCHFPRTKTGVRETCLTLRLHVMEIRLPSEASIQVRFRRRRSDEREANVCLVGRVKTQRCAWSSVPMGPSIIFSSITLTCPDRKSVSVRRQFSAWSGK